MASLYLLELKVFEYTKENDFVSLEKNVLPQKINLGEKSQVI